MRRWTVVAALAALSSWSAASGNVPYQLMDVRTASKAPTRRLEKIIVVGISNDRDLRHRFEDKLVSYLRGRGGKAITSYPLVPDFKDIGDRQRILQVLDQEGVDGVMTVRAVAVDDMGEENWAAAWKSNLAKDSSVRDLIEQSLPLTEKTAKHYGVEFALWDRRTPGALWAARSGVHTRKQLRKGVTELLNLVIAEMRYGNWF